MLSLNKTIVLYGSETGNSEALARRIGDEATEKISFFKTDSSNIQASLVVSPLDSFEAWLKANSGTIKNLAIIVVSSTGDGEAPKGAVQFLNYLELELKSCNLGTKLPFEGVYFALLGMGDKDYDDTFGKFPSLVFEGLVKLGAKPILSLEITDENEGIELVSEPWIEKLWPAITQASEERHIDSIMPKAQPIKPMPSAEVKAALVPSLEPSNNAINSTLPPIYDQKLNIEVPDTFDELKGLPRMPAEVCSLMPVVENTETPSKDLPLPQFVKQAFPSLIWGQVKKVSSLTSSEALKRTLALELEVPRDSLYYIPGDVIGIPQPNDSQLVTLLLQRLRLDADSLYLLSPSTGQLPSHLVACGAAPVTPRVLLSYAVDISIVLKKPLLRVLSQCCTDPSEATALDWLASKQGASQFTALRDQAPTLLELLNAFPSSQPSLARLLDVLSPLQPRHYSITSTPLNAPSQIQLIFNVVQYRTQGLLRHGLFTPWFDRASGLAPAKSDVTPTSLKLPFFLKPHGPMSFHLPSNPKTPLILVGPGTGIAPLLSFVRHRQAQRSLARRAGTIGPRLEEDIRARYGPIWLIAGFRHPDHDFLASEELHNLVQDATLDRLDVAFSRLETASFSQPAGQLGCLALPSHTGAKYVQDALTNNATYWRELMISKGACFYLCGDAGEMARDVNATLLRLLGDCDLGELTPAAQMAAWNKEGRIKRDLW
ncbi:hypothetical protein DSO57_1006317 [Entomophthora muscae]|uniref:Uncharacterized protein n=1 Tax=Entomophthora muscae TaxID=34485 RepID=A0ACC2T7G2_9FUNG|nr:hypothetical protein DSO57_1006317 [Entomophthora muscae]